MNGLGFLLKNKCKWLLKTDNYPYICNPKQ